MTRQVGNELDEFVTDALRNQLLGLPLDLATLNMARARDTGIPTLNAARRAFYARDQHLAGAVRELDRLRLQHQAPRVADQLRRGVRHPPVDHRPPDAARGRSPANGADGEVGGHDCIGARGPRHVLNGRRGD